jgi:hypothetical protein
MTVDGLAIEGQMVMPTRPAHSWVRLYGWSLHHRIVSLGSDRPIHGTLGPSRRCRPVRRWPIPSSELVQGRMPLEDDGWLTIAAAVSRRIRNS